MPQTSVPEFRAIGPTEQGWWTTLHYAEPGMRVPFDGVNGLAPERCIGSPLYVLDVRTDEEFANHDANGLFAVVSGCLVDVGRFTQQCQELRASGQDPRQQYLDVFSQKGSVLSLAAGSEFTLPPQVVQRPLEVEQADGSRIKPLGKHADQPIRSISADMRGYDVHSPEAALRFLADTSLQATGIIEQGGVQTFTMHGNMPLSTLANALHYQIVPAVEQARARRPLNREEEVDALRQMLANAVVRSSQGRRQ